MGEEEFETFGFYCTRKSRDGSNIQKLNDDVLEVINEYVPINNLLDTCKELHKLKKNFILVSLNWSETIKFLKDDKYRDYLYSLIDNPRKQLILNISFVQIRSLDFIFNKDRNFDQKYLDILNNVYLYQFINLSLFKISKYF